MNCETCVALDESRKVYFKLRRLKSGVLRESSSNFVTDTFNLANDRKIEITARGNRLYVYSKEVHSGDSKILRYYSWELMPNISLEKAVSNARADIMSTLSSLEIDKRVMEFGKGYEKYDHDLRMWALFKRLKAINDASRQNASTDSQEQSTNFFQEAVEAYGNTG